MSTIKSIEEFSFYIGSFFGDKYKVHFKNNKARYLKFETFEIDGNEMEQEITSNDVMDFIQKLNNLKVTDWQETYLGGVLDGEEWNLKIKYNQGDKIKSYGCHHYPGNKPGRMERSKAFNNLLSYIEGLLGQPGFFH